MNVKTHKTFNQIVTFLEMMLAVIIIVAVVAEAFFLVSNLFDLIINEELTQNFEEFLSGVLLYIICLEVALMLITRNPNLIIEILVFAIARKMILSVKIEMIEIAIGILSIALLYGLKYMILEKMKKKKSMTIDESENEQDSFSI